MFSPLKVLNKEQYSYLYIKKNVQWQSRIVRKEKK